MKILVVAALFLTSAVFAHADIAASPSPNPLSALAEKMAATKSEAERDAIGRTASPEALGDHSLRVELTSVAFQFTMRGDYARAEEFARYIIHFAQAHTDPEGIAIAQVQLAAALREMGNEAEAIELLKQSLAWSEKNPGDSKNLIRASQTIGVLYLDRSDFVRALTHLERALELARKKDYRDYVIPCLNSIGEVYRSQGEPERALRYYEEARVATGDDTAWNMSFIFNNIGQARAALGQTDQAIEAINKSRAIAEKKNFRPRVATSLAVLGKLEMEKGNWERARKSFNESLDLSRELRDRSSEARALLGLAETARRAGEFELGLEPAAKAIEIYRAMRQSSELASAKTTEGQILRALKRDGEAQAALAEAIQVTEQTRARVAGGSVEAEEFFAQKTTPYLESVTLLAGQNKNAEALEMAERASARVLLDLSSADGGRNASPLSKTQEVERQDLQRTLANLRHAQTGARDKSDQAEVANLQVQIARVRDAQEEFESRFAAPVETSQAPPVALAEVQKLTTNKTALLRFVVTDEGTLLFVLRDHAPLQVFSIAISASELSRRVSSFRQKLADRALDWQQPARDLYETLLAKAPLTGTENLVIVPDGALWNLPFQALRNGEHILIEDHAISYAPSLSLLVRQRVHQEEKGNDARLFAVGNPALGDGVVHIVNNLLAPNDSREMGEKWAPLPAAEKQVETLLGIYGDKSRILTGAAAREEIVKREAPAFDILHFATHGVLNDRAPLYSYLLLAQTEKSSFDDGLLEGWELSRMKLRARLAVLSACETARGQVRAGEGMIGLSWAFFLAGCPTTVVSQWKVDSDSNSDLMIEFHRQLHRGKSTASALREAAIALSRSPLYRHPFYWAPFVAVGDAF